MLDLASALDLFHEGAERSACPASDCELVPAALGTGDGGADILGANGTDDDVMSRLLYVRIAEDPRIAGDHRIAVIVAKFLHPATQITLRDATAGDVLDCANLVEGHASSVDLDGVGEFKVRFEAHAASVNSLRVLAI